MAHIQRLRLVRSEKASRKIANQSWRRWTVWNILSSAPKRNDQRGYEQKSFHRKLFAKYNIIRQFVFINLPVVRKMVMKCFTYFEHTLLYTFGIIVTVKFADHLLHFSPP